MRCLLLLGYFFVLSVTYSISSPSESRTDRTPIIVTNAPPCVQSPSDKEPAAGVRTETLSHVSRNSSKIKSKSKTKNMELIKTKHLKDGSTVEIIIDKSRTKNKTREITDSLDQTNSTVSEGGVKESTSLTEDKKHKVKDVSIQKKVTKERIVRDKNGNIVSDTVKSKTSEKDRKVEKDKETDTLVHTKKKVTTEAPCATPPPPPCDTTTTKPPQLPCGCKRTTTTTEVPETYPCEHPKPTE